VDNQVVYKEFIMTTIIPVGATIPGVTHHRARVNGTGLHYVAAGGSGTPVLLVHGFPETWWAFRRVIPFLAAHHRVHAVDLRGFGDSDIAGDNLTVSQAADDLHALIEHLSLGPMHLVGQDVSGGVVHHLAATHPEDLISLTAIESGLAGFGAERLADVTHGGVWYIGALAAPGVAGMLFEKAAGTSIGEYLYPLYGVAREAVGEEDVAEYARSYGRSGGFAGAAGLYGEMLIGGPEVRALAQTSPLQIPVTTIGSRGGEFTRAAFGDVTANPVTAIQLDGVGHYVAQEAPQRLAETLIDAFAGHSREAQVPGVGPLSK
jgi:pimeloyl-ACP methyl ester carboxylesterase